MIRIGVVDISVTSLVKLFAKTNFVHYISWVTDSLSTLHVTSNLLLKEVSIIRKYVKQFSLRTMRGYVISYKIKSLSRYYGQFGPNPERPNRINLNKLDVAVCLRISLL